MIVSGSSLVLCAYSATSFNTASPVDPDWHDFIIHMPSLLTVLAATASLLLSLALLIVLVRTEMARSRHSGGSTPPTPAGLDVSGTVAG